MNRVELPHDKGRFGPLRAAIDGRPELVRLVALIRTFADAEDRALPEAARLVLDRLSGLELFELSTDGDAQRVGSQQAFNMVWPNGSCWITQLDCAEPEDTLQRGPGGALAAMRCHWADSPNREPLCAKMGWDTDQCAGLAILRARAEALFPEVFGQAESVQAPAPASLSPLAEPPAEELAPLAGFSKGASWKPADLLRFAQCYATAKGARGNKEVALRRLAVAGWANSWATLQKRITQANELLPQQNKAPKAA
jgi:hypothetical protein